MIPAARIETARLVLVPFADAHVSERYVAWLNDPAVTAYSEQRHRRHDRASCLAYVGAVRAKGDPLWAIERRADGLHIGNIAAYVDRANGLADLAILIGERAAWGQGYGTEAWRAACRWLFDEAAIRKIGAGAMAENAAMRAIMRACGMRPDGERKRHLVLDGREVDVVYAALFREDRPRLD